MKELMALVMVSWGVCSVWGDQTAHVALDTTSGTRVAAATETIRFSPLWETGAAGACATVGIDGAAVTNATEAGAYLWMPTRNGTYTLTHQVIDGGVQVGETLTATFVVDWVLPENPVFTPASGTIFEVSLSVSISCPSEGATIHYTTDGSEPTLASPVYKRFRVSGKTTVKARAFDADGRGSEVVTAEYALGQCGDPVIVSAGGTTFAHAGNVVRIDYEGDEGVVRYTRDGSEPTGESPLYTGEFTVDDSTVVKAKVFSDRFFDSQTVTANLVREWTTVATPVITAASPFMGSKTKVVIACATDGALVRYTTDGSDPNSHATKYTGPFYVTADCTMKAYGALYDHLDSAVAAKTIVKTWGIGDTLGKPDHAFTTGGDAGFVRVTDATAPLGESMKSGAITDNQVSTLETTVTGPGTVSFQWKTSCEEDEEYHEWDHAEFLVDGVEVARLDGISEWKTVSARVDGAGAHTLTWRYVKDDVEKDGEDCVWVADWAWASDFTATQTTTVPVPYAWLLANSRDVVDEYASYEAVAKQMAANGVNTVEDCYVAGLDPEDETSVFKARIELVDGQPVVTPSPDLKEARAYTVHGRTSLDDAEGWTTPVKPEHRFFRISVEMP
ncbi:MAG: chitobiase/beta-hexosaminidase C-terminal domain-containing protein [Kiritimatiellia bacterium]